MSTSVSSLIPYFAIILTFFTILLGGIGVYQLIQGRKDSLRKRLGDVRKLGAPDFGKTGSWEQNFRVHWLKPVGEIIIPAEEWRKSEIRKRLVLAGYRGHSTLYLFLGIKLVAAVAGLALVFLGFTFTGNFYLLGSLPGIVALIWALAISFYLPDFFLRFRANTRRVEFQDGFPDALDILVVCIEAGLGLDAALQRVNGELRKVYPNLASELTVVSYEIRAGRARRDALKGFADRVDIPRANSFVTVILQAEQFGSSISSALKTFAEEMRRERITLVREKAAKLPVKLVLPVAVFILPAVFIVVLGPALMELMTLFTEVF